MEKIENITGLEVVQQEAEKIFEGGAVNFSEKVVAYIKDVEEKVQAVTITSPAQIAQVETLGGSATVIENKTADIDAKIAAINTETVQKINEIKNTEILPEKSQEELGKIESKETFSIATITDPDLLDKIAQLEAIDSSGNFDQERYDKYKRDELNNKHGNYSVTANQERVREALEMGDKIEDVIFETIYGEGGWNRYVIDSTNGAIKLSRAKDQTTLTPESRIAIDAKAREFGIQIGL